MLNNPASVVRMISASAAWHWSSGHFFAYLMLLTPTPSALRYFSDRTADLTWLMRSSVGAPLTRAMTCPLESITIT